MLNCGLRCLPVVRALTVVAASWLAGGLLLIVASAAAAEQSAPDPIAAEWGVPEFYNLADPTEFAPSWSKRLTGYLEARDGTRLRYSVLLPRGKGQYPVIVNYSGYDPGSIGGSAYRRNDTAMSASLDRTLLEHGYAVLGVNARGTGCSQGKFDFLLESYGTDGADAVEWAAKQPWSNGAIGMANWSWAGMSQLATASERPPHLKAIAPGMPLTDPRSDSWAIGGVPSQGFITGWWQFLHSRWLAARHSAQTERDAVCLEQVDRNYANAEVPDSNLPSLLIRHPLRDSWIESKYLLGRVDRIAVPMLSMESFQDEATTVRSSYFHDRIDPARFWLLQTNGNHDLYESLQFRATLIAFLDHFVKGADNGFDKQPHLVIWQETDSKGEEGHLRDEGAAPRWQINFAQYPPSVGEWVLNLGANHALTSSTPVAGAPDAYTYPVNGPIVNVEAGFGAWGPLAPDWREGSVAYTSAPLDHEVVTFGSSSVDLWVSTSASDSDLQVTLTELRPDGQERFLQRGWLRLSDRAIDEKRSTRTRPILCDRIECIAAPVPERPVLARVELSKLTHAFRVGSRVRIWIDAPSATGENSFDHSSIPSTNRIWHDPAHPSRIVFGTFAGVDVPKGASLCGHVLMEPCRSDPLAP